MAADDDAFEFLKRKINNYITLNDQDTLDLVNYFKIRLFEKNQFLLRENQICNFWGFIQQGLVRSYSLTNEGDEYTLGCMHEGSFISESLSFIQQVPSSVNVHALEDTVLICITYAKLQELYIKYPVFEKFARMLYEERLSRVKAGTLYRVQLSATERYIHFINTQPELIKRVPLKYIASYLNITDSTLSRIRGKIGRMKV
ncbi:cAMP-binding domain of CRP or a regulatory subunit of cAMP-dependent protein kinases [Mucilaginibacter mallensis]|uniref:cAMP-binding domain of CRP or a regulatory subunit of cAMP-dependent protein kinases n=1 Tax=Mucilaginibacter mallensis TaxID=652787 RepID=A0A1H2CCZ9_MUCMA|nr:Crp/Fnr family transcriptional regulator [Mucilaginibacter mallensis]SDT68313.1 cAMP-binding domain of CRP or a regulatory subunit of cAMP-dependent protein kinases [Mucilaginibacter mallensis]